MLAFLKKLIPRRVFNFLQPIYHHKLALLAALAYRFPSRHLYVIGITGTNGKSTTVELLSQILKEAGHKTASFSSVRFRIGEQEWPNDLKMTMPGRFAMQKLLWEAVRHGCTHAVLEVTSEGIKQFRHKFIKFDMAILTNITPEHIESHGSFDKYRAAKAELFHVAPIHVLNAEDTNIEYFRRIPARKRILYHRVELPEDIHLGLAGEFNRENAMAALAAARALGIDEAVSKRVLERVKFIPGRLQVIQEEPFRVLVDYAHTPDALQKVYETLWKSDLRGGSASNLICVFGCTGGGRDRWKRPEMGRIAATYCRDIILTNDDPYDEDPAAIINEIEKGFYAPSVMIAKRRLMYEKIADRRLAIRRAILSAHKGDTVILTGKGSESVMVLAGGKKIPWDDREVAREELAK